MNAVYLNPNVNFPKQYPLLKSLAIIYDHIFIWSPVSSRLERSGITPAEFLTSLQPNGQEPPILVPAGRDVWFQRAARQNSPDKDYRDFDPAFEAGVYAAAQEAKRWFGFDTIIPASQRDECAGWCDTFWDDSARRRVTESLSGQLTHIFDQQAMVRLQDLADRRRRTFDWAVSNHFIQEIFAVRQLKGVVPITSSIAAPGYVFAGSHPVRGQRDPNRADLVQHAKLGGELPHLPAAVSVSELCGFLHDVFRADERSWPEVLEIRRRYSVQVRHWLNRVLSELRREVPQSLDQMARSQVRIIYDSASGTLWLGIAGIAECVGLSSAAALAIAIPVLRLFRMYTPLVREFARFVAGEDEMFLIDSPLFESVITK